MTDEWQFLDEVDVIAKWPAEMRKFVLEGGKWSERKQGLEALNTLIEQNPRLSTTSMTIYGELMDEIRKILDRESNIVVVTTTVRTVELLATGLRHKFAGFIGMVLPFLIKRAKDKKKNVRDAILAAVGAVSDTTSPERLQKDIIDWFSIPSPESKQTLLAFLFTFFCKQNAPDVPFVKAIAPLCVKAATESDVTVRDKACATLGSIKRLMVDAISAFLAPISTDAAKLDKINQYMEEAVEEAKKIAAARPQASGNLVDEEVAEGSSESPSETPSTQTAGIDPWTLLDAEDVTKKIDKNVESQLVDKNWKERVAGAESVKKEVEAVGRLEISDRLREILILMCKIIEKDVNVNVAALAAQTLSAVAQRARFAFASLANRSFPIIFDKLKDKKAVLRDALNELCDAAAITTPLSAYVESIIGGLSAKNPQSRQQTALFLARFFAKNDAKTTEVEAVKQLVEQIQKTSNDADKEVREAVIRLVAAIQKSLGENVAKRLLADVFEDKMKAEKIPGIVEQLETEFGKAASAEMVRLAQHYNLGVTVSSAPPKKATGPTQKAPRAPPSVNTARRAPTAAQRPPTAAPVSAPKPKPFVARPAPNFGAPAAKPRVATVAPSTARPISKVSGTPRPANPPTTNTNTATTSLRLGQVRGAPIAPNVVRNGTVPTMNRPVGIARPQTSGIAAPRSRIGSAAPGIVRPATGRIARPPSTSRIARPPSAGGVSNGN
uniref:TOG domain-containing protein n=1 Tax=Caenorhabditis japonica TaxID=281687 RepID=A0A8R1DJK6_CAEJA